MVFLVMLLIAVAVVVLVMRAASTQDGAGGTTPKAKPPRTREQLRPLAPDDDPDFIRELERRTRRDDGSPA